MLTALIPARNEPYLQKTITSLLDNAEGEIEVVVVLDGYWPDPQLLDDPRVRIIHFSNSRGMRNAINSAVAIARGEYLLKTDAHCLFAKGYDTELIKSCEQETVIVPRRYRLDPEKWEVIQDGRPPIDRMKLENLHGKDWQEGNTDAEIEETPSSQGSCWLMRKDYFHFLELMDEQAYGTFWNEFQEIGLKCWLSGGRVLVNKKTSYAHWHKQERGYSLNEKPKLQEFSWHKATKPLSWLMERSWI